MHPRTTARRPAYRPGLQLSLRNLNEAPALGRAGLARPGTDVEVVVCDGPCVGEACPLLVDGTCPLGRFDAVVTALDTPWGHAIARAWRTTGTPVIDARELDTPDAAARLARHLGTTAGGVWEVLDPPPLD